jgi:hypothetical protein
MEAQLSAPLTPATKRLAVYVITEKEGTDRTFWTKVGSAFKNRDGSYNVHLDALPITGKLHLREVDPNRRPFGEPSREEVLP